MRTHEISSSFFSLLFMIKQLFVFSFLYELGLQCIATAGYHHAFGFCDSEILKKDRDQICIHLPLVLFVSLSVGSSGDRMFPGGYLIVFFTDLDFYITKCIIRCRRQRFASEADTSDDSSLVSFCMVSSRSFMFVMFCVYNVFKIAVCIHILH